MDSGLVIEGEASETDDELDVEEQRPQQIPNKKLESREPEKSHVHMDERLEQRWRILGADANTVTQRRTQPAGKMVKEADKLVGNTFQSLQGAAASTRATSSKLIHLDENLSDVLEAASLFTLSKESQEYVDKLRK